MHLVEPMRQFIAEDVQELHDERLVIVGKAIR